MLQLCIVGANKINILSYLKNNNFYSKDTFNEYKYLFDMFLKNDSFSKHGTKDKWFDILKSLPQKGFLFLQLRLLVFHTFELQMQNLEQEKENQFVSYYIQKWVTV